MEHFQPVNDKLQLDKMWDCSCGQMKVMYCCTRDPPCKRDGTEQRFYCGYFCLKHHDHMPKPISMENQDLDEKWKTLFQKIQRVYTNSTLQFRQHREIIEFCDEGNLEIPKELRYEGTQNYKNDFKWLEELHEETIKIKKEIEEMGRQSQLQQLLKYENQRLQYEKQITSLEYLEKLTEEEVFKRYLNVFLKYSTAKYENYTLETLSQLIRLKEKAFRYQKHDQDEFQPQNQDPASLLEDKTQINFDMIQIVDSKHSKKIDVESEKRESQLKKQDEIIKSQALMLKEQQAMIDQQKRTIEELKKLIIHNSKKSDEEKQQSKKVENELRQLIMDQSDKNEAKLNKLMQDQKKTSVEQQKKTEEQKIRIDSQTQIMLEQKQQIEQLTQKQEEITQIIGLEREKNEDQKKDQVEEEVKEGWLNPKLKQGKEGQKFDPPHHQRDQGSSILNDICDLHQQMKETIDSKKKLEAAVLKQNEKYSDIVAIVQNDKNYILDQLLTCKNNIEIQRSMLQTEDCLLINTQKLFQSDNYLITFHQLQRNGNILCCGNDNKLIKVYDQFTLQSTQSINVNNIHDVIWAILEHKQYLFICDKNCNVFMIDNINYNVISTHYDKNTGSKFSIEIVDGNTLIMGTHNGYLCLYDISNSKLSLKYQQQLFKDDNVSQIIRINNSNQYLLRVRLHGIKVIEMKDNTFNVIHTYFDKQDVTAIIQYHQNYLLCSTDKKYYIVDINNKTCTLIVNGYDNCKAMSLLPGFDIDTFPYVITREKQWICIINIQNKQITKLYEYQSGLGTHKGSQILFLKDQGYRFVTYGEKQGEILLFSISHNFIEKLKKQ